MRPALKYNVSKKLSQLMKVIQLFEVQVEERRFQKARVNEYYSNLFQQLYEEYDKVSKEVTVYLCKIENDTKHKIKSYFDSKYLALKDDYRKSIQETKNEVASKEAEIKSKIQSLQEEITSIMSTIKAQSIGFDSRITDLQQKMEADIKNQKEVYKSECEAHDKEAHAKLLKLQEQAAMRIKEIQDQHEKDKQDLLNAPKDTNSLSTNKIQASNKELKQRVNNLKQQVQKMKDTVKDLQQTKNSSTDENKKKIKQATQQILDGKKKGEKEVKEKQELLKKTEIDRQKETDNLIITKKENIMKHEKELKELEESVNSEIEKMNKEYQDKNGEMRSKFDNLDKDMQSIIAQREKELADVRKRHADYVQKAGETQNQLHKDIMAMKDANHTEIEKFKQHIKSMEAQHENLIADTKLNHLAAIKAEEEEFEKRKKELQNKYEKMIAGSNSETAKQQKQLHDILGQIDENRSKYKLEIEAFEKETESRKVKALEQNAKELEQLKQSNGQLYAKNEADNTAALLQATEKYKAEFENEKKKLDDKYKVTMEKILKEELANCTVAEEDSKLLDAFRELQKKHDSYVDLDVKESEFKYLDDEINQLTLKLQNNLEEYEKVIANLKAEQQRKIEEENKRHEVTIEKEPEVDPKAQQIEALEKELQQKKDSNKQQIDELNNKIKAEEERHQQEALIQEKALEQFNDTSDIDALKENIEKLRKEMNEASDQFASNSNDDEEKHKKELETMKSDHSSLKDSMKKEQDEMRTLFLSKKSEKLKEKDQARQSYEENLRNKDNEFKQRELKQTNKHVKEIDQLTKEFTDLKAELVKSGETFTQKYKETDSINKTAIDEVDKRKSAEFEKAKNDWNALLEFYNEKISVLTKRRNKARQMMEKRPPRQQEIDEAERLQGRLQVITQNLQTAMKELTEYRVILVSKEKEYQKRFGKSPKIGVLPVTHH